MGPARRWRRRGAVGDSGGVAVAAARGRCGAAAEPSVAGRAGGDDRRARRGDPERRAGAGSARAGPSAATSWACTCGPSATQIAVLEGRSLIEHFVSRPQDDVNQIDGNIYLGRVQNVLPGMEAAFVDIGTPKNAVLYRGDVRYDTDDVEGGGKADARIEQLLKPGQIVLCQVTKNPIGTKGARLTQEVSLPGRFVVLVPNSDTYGISKRLPDDERKRLRRILDDVKPDEHGLIVRTAAEGATAEELRRDVEAAAGAVGPDRRPGQAGEGARPALPGADLAVRVIREEFNKEYRGVIIDDRELYEEVRRLRRQHQPGAGRPRRVLRPRRRAAAALRALPRPRAAPQGARPQGLAAVGRLAHHRAHRGADRDRRQHRQERRARRTSRRPSTATTSRPPRRSPASCGCATSAASSSSTSSTWRSPTTATTSCARSGRPWPGTRPAPRSSTSPSSASSR